MLFSLLFDKFVWGFAGTVLCRRTVPKIRHSHLSPKVIGFVIPAKAGIQIVDSRLKPCGNDNFLGRVQGIWRRRIFIFVLAFSIYSPTLFAGQFEIGAEHPETIYRFHEHLVEAEALVFARGQAPLVGKWKDDRFYFQGLVSGTEVRLVQGEDGDEKVQAIQFNPVAKTVRRLTFHEVPPGSRIDFYYKTSAGYKKDQAPYLLLRIFLGRHLIKSMRIFGDDENWKKEEIDLGVVSLLRRNTVVTFEVSSDLTENLLFAFYAMVKQ